MTVIAKIDNIDFLSAVEEHGAYKQLVRKATVSGLTEGDYLALKEALDTSGIPSNGDSLSGIPELLVTGRSVRMLSKTSAEITITYENENAGGQDFDDPNSDVTRVDVAASVFQTQQFTDVNGDDIIVEWQPPDYEIPDPSNPGGTITVTPDKMEIPASVDAHKVHAVITAVGNKTTRDPGGQAKRIVGKVDSWRGSRKLLCTEVRSTFLSNGLYRFEYTLQFNPDSWDPWAKVHVNGELVAKKRVIVHEEVSFSNIIGGRIDF